MSSAGSTTMPTTNQSSDTVAQHDLSRKRKSCDTGTEAYATPPRNPKKLKITVTEETPDLVKKAHESDHSAIAAIQSNSYISSDSLPKSALDPASGSSSDKTKLILTPPKPSWSADVETANIRLIDHLSEQSKQWDIKADELQAEGEDWAQVQRFQDLARYYDQEATHHIKALNVAYATDAQRLREFYAANGPKKSFLELPNEILNSIYNYASQSDEVGVNNLRFLLTSKKVAADATGIAWSNTTFKFDTTDDKIVRKRLESLSLEAKKNIRFIEIKLLDIMWKQEYHKKTRVFETESDQIHLLLKVYLPNLERIDIPWRWEVPHPGVFSYKLPLAQRQAIEEWDPTQTDKDVLAMFFKAAPLFSYARVIVKGNDGGFKLLYFMCSQVISADHSYDDWLEDPTKSKEPSRIELGWYYAEDGKLDFEVELEHAAVEGQAEGKMVLDFTMPFPETE
ncbi:hypothetical protein EJ08DRAFT_656236 [Tothia fuscella]|uniref:Uncharacterized protein n=1 Tax=Tothia fuscella TaxID=1048955 RepID=A0A9P4U4A6_9PEZI|nr:hypothetical protein EJ08DRAFT_656236 [Tothia fuscella]